MLLGASNWFLELKFINPYQMKSYRELEIYKLSKNLAIEITKCDETILHLEFLFETNSLTSKELYEEFCTEYTRLSKMMNRFVQWIKNNLK